MSYNYAEDGWDGTGRLRIGPDSDLLLDAARWVARAQVVRPDTIQRHVRVGFVKAVRLTLLLEQEGLIGPREGWGHKPLVMPDSLPAALEHVREAAAREAAPEAAGTETTDG